MRGRETVAVLIVLAMLYALPTLASNQPYILHIVVTACIFAIPAVGLNLMLGYTGLISLGHMGFAGVGAYVAAILMVDAGWSFWAATPVAVLSSAALGALIGLPCLRLRSHFFIIVTLAFGLVLFSIMNNWDSVTRGAEGMAGIPRPDPIVIGGWTIKFFRLPDFYLLALTATVLVFALQMLIVRSNFGATMAAIRQDETLAAFKGVNTMLYKVTVFAIGSGIAGLGGVFQVTFLRVAAPLSFDMLESINIVVMVILGGSGFLAGPALGAALFVAIPEFLRIAADLRLVIFGLVLLLFTLFAPKGCAGMIAAVVRRLRRNAP
jgi:branched-chain amino acid transport system permease protein